MLDLTTILILGFAAIGTAQVMVNLDGPWKFMARIRAHTTIGGLLECIYCSAWWAAIIYFLMLQVPILAPVVYIPAAAGVAATLWRYTGGEFTN